MYCLQRASLFTVSSCMSLNLTDLVLTEGISVRILLLLSKSAGLSAVVEWGVAL